VSFFQEQYQNFSLPLELPGPEPRAGFREPQLGAIHSIAGHFAQSGEQAIVTMPTGSGKTAVIVAACFVLRAKRALIISPSRLVREQIAEQFDDMSLLRRLHAFDLLATNRPKLKVISSRIRREEDWNMLADFDVVVATLQSVSPGYKEIPDPPENLFDVVVVDEAHHASASTWDVLLRSFPRARRILFTATPFRRDGKEIRGNFVYTYPLEKARLDGVFGKIRYEPVDAQGPTLERDVAVAKQVEQTFRADRTRGFSHLVLVRTDTKERAKELSLVYAEHTSLNLISLNSSHSLAYAKRTIKRLRAKEIDGIITVNMLGEGFDFPNLKIAGIHSPHKSLAATLQFIGRFARTSEPDLGIATFHAVPEDIEIEREKLFKHGAAWQEIVENLSSKQIEKEAEKRRVLGGFQYDLDELSTLDDFSLHSLQPQCHVKIYRVYGSFDVNQEIEFPGFEAEPIFHSHNPETNSTVWIIRRLLPCKWDSDGTFVDVNYELLFLHHHRKSQLLFVGSTIKVEGYYSQVVEQLTGGDHTILSLNQVNRVLNGWTNLEFFNVGVRNKVPGVKTESYRILTGPDSSKSISPLMAKTFYRGHSFGKGCPDGGEVETIGISSSSKVWSNKSLQLHEFILWCEELAKRISQTQLIATNSNLDLLSAGDELSQLPAGIFYGLWHENVFSNSYQIVVELQNKKEVNGDLLDAEINIGEYQDDGSLRIHVNFQNYCKVLRLSAREGQKYSPDPDESEFPKFRVERAGMQLPLDSFLTDLPPVYYCENLDVIQGNTLMKRVEGFDDVYFGEEQLVSVDWSKIGVNVNAEYGEQKPKSIQSYLAETLPTKTGCEIVYWDHGPGEAADFICFVKDTQDTVEVQLYHCKKASGEAPANRVNDLYDVLGQSIKSTKLGKLDSIVSHIKARHKGGRGVAKFAKGDIETLNDLSGRYPNSRTSFKCIIVQPGFNTTSQSDKVKNLCLGVDEIVRFTGFHPLVFWGSSDSS